MPGRTAPAILTALMLALAACSGSDSPSEVAAAPATTSLDAPLTPVEPDFDTTKNAFYRECMQSQQNVKECTCTTQTLKDGVDPAIYASMVASGMSAVIPLKGAPSEAVNKALRTALKTCRGR